MKVILIEDVDNLGIQGDTVDVRPGYARNYLIPKKLAWQATPGNLKRLAQQKRVWEVRSIREKSLAESLREQVEALTITFHARAGAEEQLYGSITTADIAEGLEEKGVVVDKRKIRMTDPIKRLGDHTVTLRLHRDVEADLRVLVLLEGEEPEDEAAGPVQSEQSEEQPSGSVMEAARSEGETPESAAVDATDDAAEEDATVTVEAENTEES